MGTKLLILNKGARDRKSVRCAKLAIWPRWPKRRRGEGRRMRRKIGGFGSPICRWTKVAVLSRFHDDLSAFSIALSLPLGQVARLSPNLTSTVRRLPFSCRQPHRRQPQKKNQTGRPSRTNVALRNLAARSRARSLACLLSHSRLPAR